MEHGKEPFFRLENKGVRPLALLYLLNEGSLGSPCLDSKGKHTSLGAQTCWQICSTKITCCTCLKGVIRANKFNTNSTTRIFSASHASSLLFWGRRPWNHLLISVPNEPSRTSGNSGRSSHIAEPTIRAQHKRRMGASCSQISESKSLKR